MTTRTTSRFVTGLLGALAIAAVLFGVPAALWAFGGSPLPGHLPGLGEALAAVTTRDDGTLFLGALKLVGWIGWLAWALPLVLEIASRVRGVRAPRLSGLRMQQRHAAVLVTAAAALMGVMGAGSAHAAPVAPPAQVAAASAGVQLPAMRVADPGSVASTSGVSARPVSMSAHERHVAHLAHVQHVAHMRHVAHVAHVRHLAHRAHVRHRAHAEHVAHLERVAPREAARVKESARSSAKVKITESGVNEKGYPVLRVTPKATPRPATSTPPASAPATPAPPVASPSTPRPAAPAASAPAAARPSSQPRVTAAPQVPAPTQSATVEDAAAEAGQDEFQLTDHPEAFKAAVFTAAGLGSLSAAGLLLALARRRSQQSRSRRPGQRVPLPTGVAAQAEVDLRDGADPVTADHLDRALRTLAANAAASQTPLPGLRAARITPEAIELYLTDPDAALPRPFAPIETDPGAWVLEREHLEVALLTAEEAEGIGAPYPSLVTLGVDEQEAHLLLNLEEIGTLGLVGKTASCHEVLAAMTIELITASWADNARVTLVGLLPELATALGAHRATYIPDIEEALPILEHDARVHREALERHELDSALDARDRQLVDEAWAPHLVLVSSYLTEEDRDRLTTLTQTSPRVAVAAITTDNAPLGDWSLHVTTVGTALLGHLRPVALEITPQHLSLSDYYAIVDAFAATQEPPEDGPEWAEDIDPGVTLSEVPAAAEDTEVAFEIEPVTHGSHVALVRDVAENTDDVHEDDDADAPTQLMPTQEAPTATEAEEPTEADEADEADAPTADREDGTDDQGPRPADAPVSTPTDPADAKRGATAAQEVRERGLPTIIHADRSGEPAPMVQLLGPVHLNPATEGKPAPARVHEIIAYLALCPGESGLAFSEAMWPAKRTDGNAARARRNQAISRARSYMGYLPSGRPVVAAVEDQGYALDPDVSVDWHQLETLLGETIAATSDEALLGALRLVRGRPLSGVPGARYAWAEPLVQEMIGLIGDIAHEAASRALRAGQIRIAIWALERGLLADPSCEALWRARLIAASREGDPHAVQEVRERMDAAFADLDDGFEADTLHLIDDLTHAYA